MSTYDPESHVVFGSRVNLGALRDARTRRNVATQPRAPEPLVPFTARSHGRLGLPPRTNPTVRLAAGFSPAALGAPGGAVPLAAERRCEMGSRALSASTGSEHGIPLLSLRTALHEPRRGYGPAESLAKRWRAAPWGALLSYPARRLAVK